MEDVTLKQIELLDSYYSGLLSKQQLLEKMPNDLTLSEIESLVDNYKLMQEVILELIGDNCRKVLQTIHNRRKSEINEVGVVIGYFEQSLNFMNYLFKKDLLKSIIRLK